MKIKLLLYVISLCVILSCNNAGEKKQHDTEVQTKTIKVVEGIQVFDKYKDFEHLLQLEDDTLHVVNFWATWCKPCVAELPYFEKLGEDYKNKALKVTLVSLDDKKKLRKKVIPFVQKKQLKSNLVLLDDADYNSWIDKVSPEWSGAIPATIFYKNDKRVFKEQEFDYESLQSIITNFEF